MPFATRDDGIRLYWRMEGSTAKPTLLLLHALGTDMSVWDRMAPLLLAHFQLLRFDMRGHGASDAPSGDYSLAQMASDADVVMKSAGIAAATVAGLSIGGMVAMQLALDRPQRVSALVLICTSSSIDRPMWVERVRQVQAGGVAAVADAAMGRFLSPPFAAAHPDCVAQLRRVLLATMGYAGAAAALRDGALRERLGAIRVPTLVISGNRDVSLPFAPHSETLLASIADSTSLQVDAAHLAPVEVPEIIAAAITQQLRGGQPVQQAAAALYEAGLANRRRVLGDAWVDAALERRTSFDVEFQEMITRIAWWEIWGRAGLDERTRRLLVLAMTASLGRWEEFSLHVRTGLKQQGFSRDELKEVLMQLAIYAGVPAANTAFAHARGILAEYEGAERPGG